MSCLVYSCNDAKALADMIIHEGACRQLKSMDFSCNMLRKVRERDREARRSRCILLASSCTPSHVHVEKGPHHVAIYLLTYAPRRVVVLLLQVFLI